VAVGAQGPRLLGPDLVDGLVHVSHDVEAVQDVQREAGLLGHHPQIRPPHVAAHEAQGLGARGPEPPEKPEQGLDRPLATDPQQAPVAGVDLVHQGQIVMPSLPLDLVDADRRDAAEVLVRSAPGHGHGDRPKDVSPGRVEDLGHRAVQLKR
jgi:hypothetical protein